MVWNALLTARKSLVEAYNALRLCQQAHQECYNTIEMCQQASVIGEYGIQSMFGMSRFAYPIK
jgi:hypothetical protein